MEAICLSGNQERRWAGAAHDVNNSLTVIKCSAKLLLRELNAALDRAMGAWSKGCG